LNGSRESDTDFLRAWENRLVPFPTTAGYITHVRQILRANGPGMFASAKPSGARLRLRAL
jgi:hypothetical protein